MLEDKTVDFWEMLSHDQQKEIKEATLEIEQEQTIDYETFIAKHR
jgi:TRAP-type C4-dicarboxylate transport system substrate-binding protein